MLRIVLVMATVSGVALPATGNGTVIGPGRPLYVTNSGRDFGGGTGAHPVSAYTVDVTGVPVALGEPVPTGAGARGIVFSPDGHHAYVVALEENAIYPYAVGTHGALAGLGSPVPVGGESPFGIAISPDGRSLFTANQTSGTVSVFSIGADGRPVPRGAPVSTGVLTPRNVAVSPDGRFLFVSHGVPLDEDPDAIVTFPIRPDRTLGPARPPTPAGAAGTGIAISPDGRFLYLACSTSDAVYAFRIGADGALSPVPGSPYPAPKTPEGVAITPDGRQLYVTSVATRPVLSPDDQGIWTFAIGVDGGLTTVGPRISGVAGPGITSTPDGRRLYVSDFFTDTVIAFDISPSTGILTKIAGSPVPSGGKAPGFDAIGVLPDQGPQASLTARAQPPGQPTTFNATASADPDGQVTRYDWDFGDGTELRDAGPKPTHVYRHPGTYRVTLMVTDNEGCGTTTVFTGRSTLCHGSPAAHTIRLVTIPPRSYGETVG
jgi:DNA-binding beta-propeller fold protein YncE